MRWFRVNRRLGSHVGLFALALQLVLSFGHIHAGDLARVDGAGTVFVSSSASHPGEAPSGSVPDDADGFCAICAVIRLAGALLLPQAPAVAVASAQPHALMPVPVVVLVPDDGRGEVRARAPPA